MLSQNPAVGTALTSIWRHGRVGSMIGIRGASRRRPSHTTWHRGHVPRRFDGLSFNGHIESRQTERVEGVVAQGHLHRPMS